MAFPTAQPWATYDWPESAGLGVSLTESYHNGRVAPHDHAFHELVLVRAGRARHVTVEGETDLRPGRVILVPAQVWHAYDRCRDLSIAMWLVHPQLPETRFALLRELAPWLAGSRRAWSLPLGKKAGELEMLWKRMHALQQKPGSGLAFWSRMLEVLDAVTPVWERRGRPGGLAATPGEHIAVRRCRELIESRPDEPWTVAALAAASGGLHPAHLMRLYKNATGGTVMDALAECRLRRAANLLLSTDRSVTEIALASGWSESNYFARCFRARYGRSPRDFRRTRRDRFLQAAG